MKIIQHVTTYDDAQADARWAALDALSSGVDLFRSIADDPEAHEFERLNATDRLRAFNEEIARRERVGRITNGTATRLDGEHVAWIELALLVRERVETPDILMLAGLPMRRTGTSRGREEWHGPCPVCGEGDDRLIAWSGPNGRLWCRVCGWSSNVIGAASFIVKTGSFRDCVRFLATYSGLEAPR